MNPNICHIYGPIYLNCYGLSIALGIIIFFYLIQKNNKFYEVITLENFKNVVLLSIVIGMLGARLLWIITDWKFIGSYYQIFAWWEPGYSFLGSLIAILLLMPIYLKNINVKIIPFLDMTAIYVPLLHSIARIGCFLAGCCHGLPTNCAWGTTYIHPDVAVPEHLKFIKLHPTQLYSSFCLFIIFLLMYYIFQNKLQKSGQLISLYLIFSSLERFFNDFLRSDRDFYNIGFFNFLSLHQWISLMICLLGTILFFNFTYRPYWIKKYKVKKL